MVAIVNGLGRVRSIHSEEFLRFVPFQFELTSPSSCNSFNERVYI